MDAHRNISHFAPVFHVSDIEKSIAYYQRLGFELSFSWEEPIDYAIMKRGENISIHFARSDKTIERESNFRSLYFFVYDVDALYREFLEAGLENLSEPANREYGMRDFDLVDIHGISLSFGLEI